MTDLNIVVNGAGGRMGAALIRATLATDGLNLHGALEWAGSDVLGQDAGVLAGLGPLNLPIESDIQATLVGADAILDFTTPSASVTLAKEAANNKLIHIIGTTGCTLDDETALNQAAQTGAIIVKSGNMSLGVNLLAALIKKAANALGDEFDIEIVEMHHSQKVDAPSGTALMLGEAAADGRNINLKDNAVKSRDGIIGKRKTGTIGFSTLRGGTVIGDHSVLFAGPGEIIELSHRAQDRSLFANGAIKALLWARDQKSGYYSMQDVLGLND